MDRRPVLIAIVISLLIHYVVAETAEQFKGDPPGKRKKMVAVVQQEKKKDEPKKPPPPPPPPPPKVRATPKPAPVEAPKAPPPPEPVHEAHAAPVPSSFEMSNTGPGVDVGGPAGETKAHGPGDGETHKPEAVKKPTAVKKPDLPAESHDLGQGPAPCTEDATKPEPTTKTDIEYTDEARASGVEGRLVLKVTVDDNGAVTDVAVMSSVDPSLDAAAIAAVKQWRFKPSTKCGKPVAGTYTLARRFELGD
jgi:protein TonB